MTAVLEWTRDTLQMADRHPEQWRDCHPLLSDTAISTVRTWDDVDFSLPILVALPPLPLNNPHLSTSSEAAAMISLRLALPVRAGEITTG